MTQHRSNASVSDTLRVILVKECCTGCPADRAADGDVSATCLRAGDTVLVRGVQSEILEITTDYSGKTGTYVLCGRRLQLAAALLILDTGETVYADLNVVKVCPECGRPVVRFK